MATNHSGGNLIDVDNENYWEDVELYNLMYDSYGWADEDTVIIMNNQGDNDEQ